MAFHCRDACIELDIAVTLSGSVFVRLCVLVLALFLLKCCFDINHERKKLRKLSVLCIKNHKSPAAKGGAPPP